MKKFQITAGILAVVCLAVIGAFTLVQRGLAKKLPSETAAARWSADGTPYAQLSAFLSPDAGMSSSQIEQGMTSSLDNAMIGASLKAKENARLWAVGYSGGTTVSVARVNDETGLTTKNTTAEAVGVGGDFFLFHPLEMLSGWWFDTSETVLDDFIVIDNNLAWQFFGSPDVVGFELTVNGQPCQIIGVCEVDPDLADYYGDRPRVFLSHSFLSEFSDLPVTCVEAVIPNPVGGFAKDIFTSSLGAPETLSEIVENSARFTDRGLLERLKGFPTRSVRTSSVIYPYWANSAVVLVDKAALLYIGKLIPAALLVLLLAAELCILWAKRKAIFRAVGGKISRAVERSARNRRRKKELRRAKKISEGGK